MKYFLILLSMMSFAAAQAPRATNAEVYHYLAERSPFTADRPAKLPTSENLAENLAITGITKFPEGYFIILTDRKNTEESIIIQPGVASNVEILAIEDETENIQLTIKYKGHTAVVGFDPFLGSKKKNTPKAAAAAPSPLAPLTR